MGATAVKQPSRGHGMVERIDQPGACSCPLDVFGSLVFMGTQGLTQTSRYTHPIFNLKAPVLRSHGRRTVVLPVKHTTLARRLLFCSFRFVSKHCSTSSGSTMDLEAFELDSL